MVLDLKSHWADPVALGFKRSRSTLPSPFISLSLTLRREVLPEDLEICRSEWHTRIRLTLRSPFETHHGFTVQVRCFSTISSSGTCALSTAFCTTEVHAVLEPKRESL